MAAIRKNRSLSDGESSPSKAHFQLAASVAGALTLHAWLLATSDGIVGGGDLKPHLRLIQQMAESPGLRNVYAPAYHGIGAAFTQLFPLDVYPKLFAWLSMATLVAAFYRFQRALALPDMATVLFAWSPYHFALTTCLPKIEVAGYAICLLGLSFLFERRPRALALALTAAFWVHTSSALVLGYAAGVIALARRDTQSISALAVGTLLAAPLPLTHVLAGCSFPEALLFSHGDYLRSAIRENPLASIRHIALLANPIALVAAILGTKALVQYHRSLAVGCFAMVLLYTNELWLAPFNIRTTLDLTRGLTLLSIPLSLAGGLALGAHPRNAFAAVIGSIALAGTAIAWAIPTTCVSKPVDIATIDALSVDRCQFRWRWSSAAPRSSTAFFSE